MVRLRAVTRLLTGDNLYENVIDLSHTRRIMRYQRLKCCNNELFCVARYPFSNFNRQKTFSVQLLPSHLCRSSTLEEILCSVLVPSASLLHVRLKDQSSR